MPTKHRPLRRLTAHGAWAWFALAAACNGSDDADREKNHDGTHETESKPADSAAPAPRIAVAANDAMTRAPFDATPSADGSRIYYTALGTDANGEPAPGVFSVAASGGEITQLALGEPLTAPVNVSVSLDGKTLFVADPAASAVFTLATTGGTPSTLAGTDGYAPRGLAIAKAADGREYLYFTGRTPATLEAGLFRIDPAGGVANALAMGAPLSDPAGVVVDSKGVAYVVETSSDAATARVIRVDAKGTSTFVEGLGIGFPAGITVTRDDKTVLVSGLHPENKRDVVYFVDASSKQISQLTKTVGEFHEPAGLHRAHDADVFAWADSSANDTGTVYVLKP